MFEIARRKTSAWIVSTCVAFAANACAPAPGLIATGTSGQGSGTATDSTGTSSMNVIVSPDESTRAILDAVRLAHDRVWVEMYLLTANEAIDALIFAHAQGRDVRVLLEPSPFGAETANQSAFAQLAEAGVDVRWLQRAQGLVHAKLILIDDAIAYVMSLNLTTAGLNSNREFAVVDTSVTDVDWATRVFSADLLGADPGPPPANVTLLVSPLDPRTRIEQMIDRASRALRVEMEELSDSEIVNHLVDAQTRGVSVRVVCPRTGRSAATSSALARLQSGGVNVRVLDAPTIHAKAMVADDRAIYVGSVNLTRASLDDNREFGVLWNDPAAATVIAKTIADDAARGVDFGSSTGG